MPLRPPFERSSLAIAIVMVISFCGCGSDDLGPIHPVRGRVLQHDKPINATSGYIVFKPDVEKGNNTSFEPAGTIDSKGNFEIYTKERKGAPPGWYKVVITASGPAVSPEKRNRTTRPVSKPLLHAKYGQAKTTPLSVEVTASPADGAYDFDVTK